MRGAAAVVVALAVAATAAAQQTGFPVRNGAITFATAAADNGTQQLFTVARDGSGRRLVTHRTGRHFLPSWSPDATRVASVLAAEHEDLLTVANADGTGERVVGDSVASGPSWAPDGTRLAYARLEESQQPVVWLVGADGSAPRRIGPGVQPAWSPEGRTLAAVGADRRSIVAYDLADGTSRTIATSARFVAGPVWSPDGKELAYSDFAEGQVESQVRLVDATGGHDRALIDGYGPEWAPDGTVLAVQSSFYGSKLDVVRLDGSIEAEVATDAFLAPTWSPDSRTLAYTTTAPSAIVVVGRDGSGRHAITDEKPRSEVFWPAWSPDGTRILFASFQPIVDSDLYWVEPDGGSATTFVSDENTDQLEPAWSSDSENAAWVERWPVGGTPSEQRVRLIVDGRPVGRDGDRSPAWSPDGSRLAFVRRGEVWVERADGRSARRVGAGLEPTWSPDGRWLAFVAGGDLLVAHPDGHGRHRIVSTAQLATLLSAAQGAAATSPAWSPGGRRILFTGSASNWHAPATTAVLAVNADASGLTVVASNLGGRLAWAPDGSRFVVGNGNLVVVDLVTGARKVLETGIAAAALDPAWRPVCGVLTPPRGGFVRGTSGADYLCGLDGDDGLVGGRGRDRLYGNGGSDHIDARDGAFDVVGCGRGRDAVAADRIDLVGVDCERVRRR